MISHDILYPCTWRWDLGKESIGMRATLDLLLLLDLPHVYAILGHDACSLDAGCMHGKHAFMDAMMTWRSCIMDAWCSAWMQHDAGCLHGYIACMQAMHASWMTYEKKFEFKIRRIFFKRCYELERAIVKGLGSLGYFLGISVTRDSSEMFLSQRKYVVEILERAHMVNCNPSKTHVDTESKLGDDGDPGILDHGLQLFSSSTTSLVAYSDADWAGFPTTRRSTLVFCVFLGNNLLSWSFKHQPTLSRSSVDAENHGVANVVAETCWLRNLLHELHTPLSSTTLVYCDNIRAVYLSSNRVQHQRMKHNEIDIHFV
ncbi:ribonuclease H-like domain-containing protein [Tanacetum coccineum]|uniref:Ribonuclease H-like domain-containing protein n=1 Tax=Tanacetum coccineum TaxID=301880 RepID=A0ABQ5A5P1_9ASTR